MAHVSRAYSPWLAHDADENAIMFMTRYVTLSLCYVTCVGKPQTELREAHLAPSRP